MSRTQCSCRILKLWARDPKVPVSCDEASRTYLLQLSPDLRFPMAYCIICGGRRGFWARTKPCVCGLLEHWAADPNLSFEFDPKFNEYHVLDSQGGKLMVCYCPGCGGMAPESKRGQFFEEVSCREIAEFRKKLRGARALEEVIAILGQPTDTFGPLTFPRLEKELYRCKDVRRGACFYPSGRKFLIMAEEMEDSKLSIYFIPRAKKNG